MIKLARERAARVSDVMSRSVQTIPQGTDLPAAAAQLAGWRVSAAPVVDRNGRAIGIVSRADLLDPRHFKVGATVDDAMTRVLYAVRPTDSAMAAVRLMVKENIHRVAVVNEAGELVGMLSAMDILRTLALSEAEQDVEIEYVPLP